MTLINEATGGVVTVGAAVEFTVSVRKDGEPLDLSGKDVTATVRRATASQVPVHASLEAMSATVADAGAGVVHVALTPAQTALLDAPDNVAHARDYYLQLVVAEDDYAPNPIKFSVRRAAAQVGG